MYEFDGRRDDTGDEKEGLDRHLRVVDEVIAGPVLLSKLLKLRHSTMSSGTLPPD